VLAPEHALLVANALLQLGLGVMKTLSIQGGSELRISK
jgi:hypothetical protein